MHILQILEHVGAVQQTHDNAFPVAGGHGGDADINVLASNLEADSAVLRGTGLAVRGDAVFAVGTFTAAGLTDSSGIARWNEAIDFTPPFTLSFSKTQLLPGNLFKSRINCSERTTYLIEYSDDFQTWTPLMTNSAAQLDFTNAVALPVNRRVFRAKGIP